MSQDNILAIGIDGACWPLIDQWVDQGKLPNIESIQKNGTFGSLTSTVPPVTCPAWKCYSTGKNPGKLGVFWWENLDIENKESTIPNSKSFNSDEIWDILNKNGYTTGIVGMPLTYPPKSVDGFMVAGGPGAFDNGFTYPKRIERDLKSKFDYTPRPVLPANAEEEKETYVEKSIEQIDLDFKVAKYLHEKHPVDFLQITTFEINAPLQHLFYDDWPTLEAWELIDEHIGDLSDEFKHIIIHSDHGTSKMDRQFYINNWFESEGYLTVKTTLTERLASIGFHRDNILDILERLNIREPIQNNQIMRKFGRYIPDSSGQFGETEGAAIFTKSQWNNTKAVGLAQGPIYLNKENMSGSEYEKIRESLIEELLNISDPKNGKNPIQQVFKKEDIYHGEYTDKAPDLVALDSPRYHNKGGIGKSVMFGDSEWKGNNARNGLYAISGPQIDSQRVDADIYDLAPTILDILNIPIPDDMDGKPVSLDS